MLQDAAPDLDLDSLLKFGQILRINTEPKIDTLNAESMLNCYVFISFLEEM